MGACGIAGEGSRGRIIRPFHAKFMPGYTKVHAKTALWGRPSGEPAMRNNLLLATCIATLTLALGACSEAQETGTVTQTYGPSPTLPPPQHSWIPTVDIASVKPWSHGARPTAANSMAVSAFATGLDHPRTVYVLPNGDVLVAESNAPPKPDDGKGIRGWAQKFFQKQAGAATPTANRITLLRDSDGDGAAETRSVFISGLNSPFGMVLVGEDLYVADT